MRVEIFPSIMAKNQKELDQKIKIAQKAAKRVHLDIVDGKFAPNKVLWFDFIVPDDLKCNVHLMIEEPESWIAHNMEHFEIFLPHIEALKDIDTYCEWIQEHERPFGFALLPKTKITPKLRKHILKAQYVHVLTVKPGFYGSKFLSSQLKKIAQIRKINSTVNIIVDGGMNPEKIKLAKEAGANMFVSGSFIMKAKDPKKNMRELKRALK